MTKSLVLLFLFVYPFIVSAEDYELKKDIQYRLGELSEYEKSRCRLDIYYPSKQKGFKTVVWFHGGGLTGGSKSIPKALMNKNIAVIAVNYRLSPKVKVKQCLEDAAAAVAWAFNNIGKFGGSAEKVYVSGHSAGGYLTSMLGLDKTYLKAFKIDADRIAALIPFSGHTITHFTVRKEMGIGGKQPIIDEMAPLFHVRKDAPPLILITGGREIEMLGRYEENAYMMRMMKVNGHQETYLYEIDGHGHGAMVTPACHVLLEYLKKNK